MPPDQGFFAPCSRLCTHPHHTHPRTGTHPRQAYRQNKWQSLTGERFSTTQPRRSDVSSRALSIAEMDRPPSWSVCLNLSCLCGCRGGDAGVPDPRATIHVRVGADIRAGAGAGAVRYDHFDPLPWQRSWSELLGNNATSILGCFDVE